MPRPSISTHGTEVLISNIPNSVRRTSLLSIMVRDSLTLYLQPKLTFLSQSEERLPAPSRFVYQYDSMGAFKGVAIATFDERDDATVLIDAFKGFSLEDGSPPLHISILSQRTNTVQVINHMMTKLTNIMSIIILREVALVL